jgi:hypothetical protein
MTSITHPARKVECNAAALEILLLGSGVAIAVVLGMVVLAAITVCARKCRAVFFSCLRLFYRAGLQGISW